MRVRIHQALFAGFLGVTGLVVTLIALLVGFGVRDELRSTFQEELRRQLNLTASILEATDAARLDSAARAAALELGYRVTVIDGSGRVLTDSEVPRDRVPEMEDHSARPEVQGSLDGGTAFNSRLSSTLGEELLYAAQTGTLSDGRPVVVRIAAPLTRIEAALDRIQNGRGCWPPATSRSASPGNAG
ncbi:MAG: hypothetical protein P8188_02660 [Gemmatimonadota bacterium]